MTATCPYCDKETEICHDDGYGFQEDELYEQECDHCEKVFAYTPLISFSYKVSKAPCLNEGRHRRRRTKTYPPQHARWRCSYCGDEKPLTLAQFDQAKNGWEYAN